VNYLVIWCFVLLGHPWQDHGRMAAIFCLFLAYIPRNWFVKIVVDSYLKLKLQRFVTCILLW